MTETPWPVVDLWERLRLGQSRGGDLLTEEEHEQVDRWLALPASEALVIARLSGRIPEAFRLPDLHVAGLDDPQPAIDGLRSRGLVRQVDDPAEWSAWATVSVLRRGCRALGLPVSGGRAALQERLVDRQGWDDAPWIALEGSDLILRLERMATLHPWPERSAPVLERLGRVAWVSYTPSGGGLLPDRMSWDRWEALVDAEEPSTDALLEGIGWSDHPPGRLDRRRAWAREVQHRAEQAQRGGEHDQACAWLERLHDLGLGGAEVVRLWARGWERQGEDRRAWDVLCQGATRLGDDGRRALAPAGRRLARRLNRAWVPAPPLQNAPERRLRLALASPVEDGASRPQWEAGGRSTVVEPAVARWLQARGRRAILAEASPWRTLWGLLAADGLFADVPGALPVPHLDRPVDLWRPGWAQRRAAWFEPVGRALADGRGPELLRSAEARWAGYRVIGVDVRRHPVDALCAFVEGVPGPVWARWWEDSLRRGRSAWVGAPDLIVLPDPVDRVEGLLPAGVTTGSLLVEVKAPGDELRPAQRAWQSRWLGWGGQVEVWRVDALTPAG